MLASGFCCLYRSFGLAGGNLLVQFSDLQSDYGLEEACAIVAAGEVRVLQYLLSHFAVKFGREVAEMAFDVDELVESVELPVHLHYRYLKSPLRQMIKHLVRNARCAGRRFQARDSIFNERRNSNLQPIEKEALIS